MNLNWQLSTLFLVIALSGSLLRGAQVEAVKRPKDACRWIYDKAQAAALVAEKRNEVYRDLTEYVTAGTNISIMWSKLYLACRKEQE